MSCPSTRSQEYHAPILKQLFGIEEPYSQALVAATHPNGYAYQIHEANSPPASTCRNDAVCRPYRGQGRFLKPVSRDETGDLYEHHQAQMFVLAKVGRPVILALQRNYM